MSSLASLLKRTHIEDDEEILHAADAALKQSKGDLEAQHVRVVALLKLDRYSDAIKALNAGGSKLKEKAFLEYVYALYKSGNPVAAAEEAQRGSDRAFKHVEAQARYRAEEFSRAAELYKQLSSSSAQDEVADLRINMGAVDAQLEWIGADELVEKKKPGREDLEAFETAYNAACCSIARGELGQGEVLLKRARDLCNSLEDLSDQDKEAELLPITAQHVFVLVKLGRLSEAEALAQSIDVKTISDASTQHLAQVNQFSAAAAPRNAFLAHRQISRDVNTLKPDHPFKFQSTILLENQHALDLQSLKYKGTAASTRSMLAAQPAPSVDAYYNTLSVFNAAAHAQNEVGKEALKHILPMLEQRPKDVGLMLTIVQLYVLTGNHGSAISLLDTFFARLEQSGSEAADVRFAPGLVGAQVSLCESQGRRSHVRTELAKAGSYWLRKSANRSKGVVHLLKHAGSILLDSQEEEHTQLARDIFIDLHDHDSSDRYAAAGLLAALPEHVGSEGFSALTPIDRLIAGSDLDGLENAGIAQRASTARVVLSSRKRTAEDTKAKRPTKIRKSRLPKDYDPNKKPDPERWLPLRDRSTYRPKGKKGKARQALFSQGAVANDSDGSKPAAASSEVIKQKQGGGGAGGGANKKKKGKGGKW